MCSEFVVDLKTGEKQDYPPGSGTWTKRSKGPPCLNDKDFCPKGKPFQRELTEQNRQVYEHWKHWKLTGVRPDVDEYDIFWENALILDSITESYREYKRNLDLSKLIGLELDPFMRAILAAVRG